jgi:hypothetical protein
MARLGATLLRGIAVALGLPSDWFAGTVTAEPTLLFRIFRYPPAVQQGWGVAEHTDYGLLTILAQDHHGGLEVRGPAGWIEVPPDPGVLVVNLGDMLDRMTEGRYRSTPHRVRNTSGHARRFATGRRRHRPLGPHQPSRVGRHVRRLPDGQGGSGLPPAPAPSHAQCASMTSMPCGVVASRAMPTRRLQSGQIVPPAPSLHPARMCQPEAPQ